MSNLPISAASKSRHTHSTYGTSIAQPWLHEASSNGHLRGQWTLVAAVALNGVIGRGLELPWKLRSDLQRFKRLTMGNCLLMGRKTYESIGRPLPGRQTLVLSRQPPKATTTPNSLFKAQPQYCRLEEVESRVEPGRAVMVVGGAEVYRATLADCATLWITRVLESVEGDIFFPEINWDLWQLVLSESVGTNAHDEWPTDFQVWNRKPTA